jgi:hypothetical protein
LDSFICGFQLAWRLSNELNTYYKDRRPTAEDSAESDACSS